MRSVGMPTAMLLTLLAAASMCVQPAAAQQCQQTHWGSATGANASGSCPTVAVSQQAQAPGPQLGTSKDALPVAANIIAGPCQSGAVDSVNSSSSRGSSADSWETYIVRFDLYRMVAEHKVYLEQALGLFKQKWVWLDRANKAVRQYPTDFALLSVQRSGLQQLEALLQHMPGFKDVHPDKQIRGLLRWEPEGPLAAAFAGLSQQQQTYRHAAELWLHQAPNMHRQLLADIPGDSSGSGSSSSDSSSVTGSVEDAVVTPPVLAAVPPPAPAPAASPAELQQPNADAEEDSIWTVTKPPGRFTTKPTIGLDPNNPADRAESWGKDELRKRRRSLLDLQGWASGWSKRSRKLAASDTKVTTLLEANKLWDLGFSGKGIKVGVFDTGIREGHPHIRNIKERTNWTHQASLSDGLGHGSFVAGVIGSQDDNCPGFAPDVELYTFKVFTDDQVSYTSWFLDAFNYAIASKLHVINLSIGGPDFLDAPFVEKIGEVTSNGIIMVSAIGNDGPLYGTLNNPADQPDVIGVGGIDNNDRIASFSSRGMTTWELPAGTGRIKPDVMAYAKDVGGSKIQSGCRSLSGTSVASPVVAGAVSLLASTLPEDKRWLLNPATMKQALVEGAVRLPDLNMHEQGNGRINLPASQALLASYQPRASLIPPAMHLADCPYMWPHCKQPLYAFALPVVLNATVVNGMGVTGKFDGPPVYEGADEGGTLLHVTFAYSDVLWPWSGYLAVYVQVSPAAWNFSGNASGTITFTITSPPLLGTNNKAPQTSKVVVPLSAVIRPTPPRSHRVIWDVLHSIKYPPGYLPRDNLDIKSDVLDWHGDHPATNFHDAYNALLDAGFFVEIMASPGTCFDPANYGAYLAIDSEEEWYKEEVEALAAAVKDQGMALVVFAEWYHQESLKQMKFFDDNTRSWWTPITGGANVPALNELLAPHNITLGERILQGSIKLGQHTVQVAYGANIATFPVGGHLHVGRLNDVAGKGAGVPGDYAAFGITTSGKGHVAVFGDSNCLDSSHNMGACYDFLVALLRQLLQGQGSALSPDTALLKEPYTAPGFTTLPQRRLDVNFTRYSWVLQHPLACSMSAPCRFRQPPDCPNGGEWQHKHLQPGSEPPQPWSITRQPAALENISEHGFARKDDQTAAVLKQEQEAEDAQNTEQQQQKQPKGHPIGVGDDTSVAEEDEDQQPQQQQQQQQSQQHPGKQQVASGHEKHHGQHSPQQEKQEQQGRLQKAFVGQAVSLATFICVFGIIGVVVLWRMRSNGLGRKSAWPRRWGYTAARRSASPVDV